MTNKPEHTIGVIKNPAREKKFVQEPYEPNYVRLGKEPRNLSTTEPIFAVDEVGFDANGKEINLNNVAVPGHQIDNNDFVTFDDTFMVGQGRRVKEAVKQEIKQEPEVAGIPDVGEYLLMIFGEVVVSGNHKIIEDRVKAIIYGEDKEFADYGVDKNDIVVMKRVDIKIGVFVSNE